MYVQYVFVFPTTVQKAHTACHVPFSLSYFYQFWTHIEYVYVVDIDCSDLSCVCQIWALKSEAIHFLHYDYVSLRKAAMSLSQNCSATLCHHQVLYSVFKMV